MNHLRPLVLVLMLAAAIAGQAVPGHAAAGDAAPGVPVVNAPHQTHAERVEAERRARRAKAHRPETDAASEAAKPIVAGKPGGKGAPRPQPAAPPAVAAAPAVAAPPPAPAAPPKGSVTGLDLPRWASLRSEDVNLRVGPGTNFQIDWVYHRRDLPVMIEREYAVWRQIEDMDGIKGWVHTATLTGRRSFVIKGDEKILRATAADDGAPVARLKPGVVGHIRSCAADAAWCEVQVGDYRGFLKRNDFWGTFPNEAVGG